MTLDRNKATAPNKRVAGDGGIGLRFQVESRWPPRLTQVVR
jgi:hypothetical protein